LLGPPLPILPIFASASDIPTLRPLVTATEQQNNLDSRYRVIHSISLPDIDPQFPNAIAAELMIPKVAQFDSIDSPINCDPGFDVSKLATPLGVNIFSIGGQKMVNFVHPVIFVYKRIIVN